MALLFPLLLLLSVGGCEPQPTLTELVTQTQGKKVALVSYSANFYMASLDGLPMEPHMERLRQGTEALLAQKWSVVPSAGFVVMPEYQALRSQTMSVATPSVAGSTMPVFAGDREQLVKAELHSQTAAAIAQTVGADLIVVVYAEWMAKMEGFTTFRAVSKVVVSIYDATGRRVYHKRNDAKGTQKVKAVPYQSVLTPENLPHWAEASEIGLAAALAD